MPEQEVRYEEKFFVIPYKDLELLSEEDQQKLKSVLEKIASERKAKGKEVNNYYVCNQDESYAEKVFNVIIEGEKEKLTADKEPRGFAG